MNTDRDQKDSATRNALCVGQYTLKKFQSGLTENWRSLTTTVPRHHGWTISWHQRQAKRDIVVMRHEGIRGDDDWGDEELDTHHVGGASD